MMSKTTFNTLSLVTHKHTFSQPGCGMLSSGGTHVLNRVRECHGRLQTVTEMAVGVASFSKRLANCD